MSETHPKIILPADLEPDASTVENDRRLRDRYNSDPALKAEADKLHNSRMLAGDACPQCIEIVIKRMEKLKSEAIRP